MNKPTINVTPLIDVLLVLLIIFMVVAPLKPTSFKARVPAEPIDGPAKDHPKTLAVIVNPDTSLRLNNENGLGTVDEPAKMIERLQAVFTQRPANGDISASFADDLTGQQPTGSNGWSLSRPRVRQTMAVWLES